MADTPSQPSPEILEKLRQLREELAQKAAQQAPKDANTLAWQQSNAFKRIYPRAEGGAIHMENGGVFKEQVMPFVNRGLDNMFPLRQLMQRAYIKDLWDPVNSTMAQDIPAAVRNMNVTRQDANWGKHHMQNAARKSVGMNPLPERYFDAEKALGQINVNEFPNPDNPIKPKSARLWDDIFLNGDYKKASGGQVDIDRMRLELMNGGGKAKFLKHSKVKHPVYHGTMRGDIKEFKTPAYFGSKEVANQFADPEYLYGTSKLEEGEHPNVMPVHLNLKHPKVFTKEEDYEKHVIEGGLDANHWIKKGYDGIVYAPHGDMNHPNAYHVAFHPHQIKSAIGNRGTYDITNPDITKKNGGVLPKHKSKANLEKFLSKSYVKHRLYHGTSGKDFDNPKGTVYMTSSPDVANTYAGPDAVSPRVMPLYANMENPLIVHSQGENWDTLPTNTTVKGKKGHDTLKDIVGDDYPTNEYYDTGHVADYAKKHGYDGVIFKHINDMGGGARGWEEPFSDVHVVFDPESQLKSAIGNRGTYSKKIRDITKKNGGITHAHQLEIEERPL